jgi:putative glutamine amidotransferase
MSKRLVSVGNHFNAKWPFEHLFSSVVIVNHNNFNLLKLSKDDVVLFGGGEDISPALYKQKASRYSGATEVPSFRDTLESHLFEKAVASEAKMLGICRGAQLVCALSGGSLYQHVNNHAGRDHNMTTKEGTVLSVCSAHHQMMNPFGTKHELIAWATEVLSPVHLIEGEKNLDVKVEPEVVWFPETKALGIQYHPEFMRPEDEAVSYSVELVKKYLL